MAGRIETAPAKLKNSEWKQLLLILTKCRFKSVVEKLRAAKNTAQPAEVLFPPPHGLRGDEVLNRYLKEGGLPYRLRRIGAWTQERRLALVRITQ